MKLGILLAIMTSFLIACNSSNSNGNSPGTQDGGGDNTNKNTVDGVINGGGGKGVKCTKNGKTTVQILDIYEGYNLYSLSYEEFDGLTGDELKSAMLERLADYTEYPGEPMTASDFEEGLAYVKDTISKIRFTKKGQTLKNTNDADEVLMEEDCEVVQVAVYYSESILMVDTEYWNQLDEFNQMSLIIHELLYKADRLYNDAETSISTRRTVAHVLSDQGIEPIFSSELLNARKDEYLSCFIPGGSTEFAFFALEKSDGVRLIFSDLYGKSVNELTEAFLDGMTLDDLDASSGVNNNKVAGMDISTLFTDMVGIAHGYVSTDGKLESAGEITFGISGNKPGQTEKEVKMICLPVSSMQN